MQIHLLLRIIIAKLRMSYIPVVFLLLGLKCLFVCFNTTRQLYSCNQGSFYFMDQGTFVRVLITYYFRTKKLYSETLRVRFRWKTA
jgi:hypothetical protein